MSKQANHNKTLFNDYQKLEIKNNEQLLDFAKQRTNFARWLFKNAKDLSSALVEIEN